MKEEALALAKTVTDPGRKINLLREYVQAFILRSLSESEAFSQLSFVGGTALRFLYGLPRFSEDLDFSLEDPDGYDPVAWLEKTKRDLTLSGFVADIRLNDRRIVNSAWIRFSDLMQQAELSAAPKQKLSVKIEIDTRPPEGANLVRNVINRHVLFAIRYHDLPSLMAGKIHALLTRDYSKGRDWYDLLWYRSQRPPVEPNPRLLENALRQTGRPTDGDANWRDRIRKKLSSLDERRVMEDVRPFLERPSEVDLLTHEHLQRMLE